VASRPTARSLASHVKDREGIMDVIRPALAAALIGLSALATPSFAGKKDNSIRFAADRVVTNVDTYFNQSAVGAIFADQVWDTLIYLDPRTGDYKGQLASAWTPIDDRRSSSSCARASSSTTARRSMPTTSSIR
jgi:ABC-type transport system substrate-binding protein